MGRFLTIAIAGPVTGPAFLNPWIAVAEPAIATLNLDFYQVKPRSSTVNAKAGPELGNSSLA
jgi:hypothetical protein